MSAVVRRLPVLDEYVDGAVSAVFVGNEVLALSELATLVLSVVGDDEVTVDELQARLVEEVGEPQEGTVRSALDPILDALVERSLLSVDD